MKGKVRRKSRRPLVMWAVMVNEFLYPDSLCAKQEWAEAYLDSAWQEAVRGARVRVVKMTIEDVPEREKS